MALHYNSMKQQNNNKNKSKSPSVASLHQNKSKSPSVALPIKKETGTAVFILVRPRRHLRFGFTVGGKVATDI